MPNRAYSFISKISMVSICASVKSLYDRKKSLRKATCWDRRVTRRKASGAVGSARSVPSVHALGSKQLMVYSPDMKSM